MAKLISNIRQFGGGCREQFSLARKGEQSWWAAFLGTGGCLRRLVSRTFRKPATRDHKEAQACVKEGMKAYNARRYERAQYHFEKAIESDPNYARSHLFLGNTLYKMDLTIEAVASWHRAIAVEPGSEAAQAAEEKLQKMRTHKTQRLNQVIEQLEPRRK